MTRRTEKETPGGVTGAAPSLGETSLLAGSAAAPPTSGGTAFPQGGTAFQATLAAVLQAVPRVVEHVHAAERAALCLAHRERLAAVAADLDAASADLEGRLDGQGRSLLNVRRGWVKGLRARLRPPAGPPTPGQPGWWVALMAAIGALDEAAARIGALVRSQHAEAPAATLAHAVVARLDRHRDGLIAEAERWSRAEDGLAA